MRALHLSQSKRRRVKHASGKIPRQKVEVSYSFRGKRRRLTTFVPLTSLSRGVYNSQERDKAIMRVLVKRHGAAGAEEIRTKSLEPDGPKFSMTILIGEFNR